MAEKQIMTQSSDWDWGIAREYMNQAVDQGRTEDDGLWDYLATFGISSPQEDEAFLRKFDAETSQIFERIESYMDEMKRLARAAQQKYAGV
jgi:hypothetical protein